MITRRGANVAPDLSTQKPTHPVSEIVRLHERTAPARPERAQAEPCVDDDDLYGNLPFTD